ncbi:hypothetical protein EFL25_00030 [Enterococcus faecium]|nr:hypothetical protein [Enterococcus faecium]MBO1093275.1 hypothetical protein [Enterococcus lactis]RAX31616.1 hypothetical protein DQE80_04050 [Enterococcus sp. HPCN18]HAW88161.1 hypothetical protein [Enterococcus sp.]EGP5117746.1 hypothetical protein [Enterococcus faecium]
MVFRDKLKASGGISFNHSLSSFSFIPFHFTTNKKKRKAKAFLTKKLYHTEHTFATFFSHYPCYVL